MPRKKRTTWPTHFYREDDNYDDDDDDDYMEENPQSLEPPSKKSRLATTKATDEDSTNNSILTSSRMVTISVGLEKIRFVIHEGAFAHPQAGGFFNKACVQGSEDVANDVLTLPEDNPKAFGIFVRWLYGISLNLGSAVGSISSVCTDAQSRISVYIFAQKYLCPDLQDGIMSDMYQWICQGRKAEEELSQDVLELFMINAEPSHMHTLLAKWIARDTLLGDIKDKKAAFDMVPKELLLMVMAEMCGGAHGGSHSRALMGPRCDYHLHDGLCSSDSG